jgi:predicted acylesterase/phospholipase RssA
MKYFTHLVCSGNAIRSICLLGILRYIYFNKMENFIKNAAGTSMGSYFCLAFALKIPIDELEAIIIKTINNKELRIIPTKNFIDFFMNLGLNDSRIYLTGIREYVKNKYNMDDITFMELSKLTGVNIYVSTTKVNDGTNFIFNVNDTPNISVFDAIAASMCVPILSKPIKINNCYYIDGCISNNLPYNVFDNINHENILCVAVFVKSDYDFVILPETKENEDINLMEYIKQVCDIFYFNSFKHTYINKIENFKNPLIISKSHFKTTLNFEITKNEVKFNISQDDIETLILQGFKDMSEYMKNTINEEVNDS